MFYDRILKVENAGNGKTAIVTPSLNATYDKIILRLAGGLAAVDITEIRGKANDVDFFIDTGPNLDLRQAYQGIDTDVAELVIDFTEPNARGGPEQQYLAALPANKLKKLVFEVDIAANQAGAEDFTQLTAAAEYRGPTDNPFILKRRKFIEVLAAAAEHDVFLPSGASGGIIKRLWLHESTANRITALKLKVGGMIAQHFRTRAEITRIQERNGRVPQSGLVCLDFIVDGNLQGALNTSGGAEVLLQITTDGAVTLTGFVDYTDPIDRLK